MVSDLSSRWCTGAGFLKARSSHCTVWCAQTQHRNEHVLLMWLLHSTVNFKPPQLSYPISADLHSSAISSSAHISPGYFLLSNKPDLIFSVVVSDAPWLSWRWIRNKTKKSLDSLTEDLSLFLFFKLLGSFKIKNKRCLWVWWYIYTVSLKHNTSSPSVEFVKAKTTSVVRTSIILIYYYYMDGFPFFPVGGAILSSLFNFINTL